MFYYGGITRVDLSRLDISEVSNMGSMFSNCAHLTEVDFSRFDTSASIMGYMFENCVNLTRLDISKLNTSMNINFGEMFSSCGSNTTEGCLINCPNGLDMSSANSSYCGDMFKDARFNQPIHLKNVPQGLLASGSSPDDWTLVGVCGGTRGVHYIIDSVKS